MNNSKAYSALRATPSPYRSMARVTFASGSFAAWLYRPCFNRCPAKAGISYRLARRVSAQKRRTIPLLVSCSRLTALRPSRGAERPAPRTPSGGRTPAAIFFGGSSLPAPHTPLASVFHGCDAHALGGAGVVGWWGWRGGLVKLAWWAGEAGVVGW